MSLLGTYTKQPGEKLDYDVDYTDWIGDDTLLSHVVSADAGITVVTSAVLSNVVKVWLTGGTDGVKYKITVTATTTGGRIKEDEFYVKVKAI